MSLFDHKCHPSHIFFVLAIVSSITTLLLSRNIMYGPRNALDLFFVGGPFARMNFGRDIEVAYQNDTSASAVVARGAAGEQRRLQSLASAPWTHIGSAPWTHIGAGVVGLSGTDAQVAGAPWSHIVR